MHTNAAITGLLNLALFGFVLLIRRRVHGEGLTAFGLGRDARSWWLFVQGSLAGTLAFLAYLVAVVVFGFGDLSTETRQLLPARVCAVGQPIAACDGGFS